jgi:hypothetical protein
MLKKIGAIYIQQSVCVFPHNARVRRELSLVCRKVEEEGGEFHLLPLHRLEADEQRKLVAQFLDQTSKHYREIIENCEVNFQREIEFEIFRKNFTYEEAEEIRTEFEKIVTWFKRVNDRDWFGAPARAVAEQWLVKCEDLVDDFETRVFAAQQGDSSEAPPSSNLVPPPRTGRGAVRTSPGEPASSLRTGVSVANVTGPRERVQLQ